MADFELRVGAVVVSWRRLVFQRILGLLIIVTPDFHGGYDDHEWMRERTSATARFGQDFGRFSKDGGNEREDGTQIPRQRRAPVAAVEGRIHDLSGILNERNDLVQDP